MGLLRDTTATTGIVMVVIYLVCSIVAGSAYISTITEQNILVIFHPDRSAVRGGCGDCSSGVRLIPGDCGYLRSGISQKLIPNSIPAVDCAVFFYLQPDCGGDWFYQLLYRRPCRHADAVFWVWR